MQRQSPCGLVIRYRRQRTAAAGSYRHHPDRRRRVVHLRPPACVGCRCCWWWWWWWHTHRPQAPGWLSHGTSRRRVGRTEGHLPFRTCRAVCSRVFRLSSLVSTQGPQHLVAWKGPTRESLQEFQRVRYTQSRPLPWPACRMCLTHTCCHVAAWAVMPPLRDMRAVQASSKPQQQAHATGGQLHRAVWVRTVCVRSPDRSRLAGVVPHCAVQPSPKRRNSVGCVSCMQLPRWRKRGSCRQLRERCPGAAFGLAWGTR